MSDKRYTQADLNKLRFRRVEWGTNAVLIFFDMNDAEVHIPMNREAAIKFVQHAIPALLPTDGGSAPVTTSTATSTTARPAAAGNRPSAYIQLGRCDGALFTASTSPQGDTLYYRDGRKIPRSELPESIEADVASRNP